jgi:hypothetical protein
VPQGEIVPSEMWAVSPTVIEPAMQRQLLLTSSGPDMVAVGPPKKAPVMKPSPRRVPRLPAIAAVLGLVLGFGAWRLLRNEPVAPLVPPLHLEPLSPALPDASAASRPEPVVAVPVDEVAPPPEIDAGPPVRKHRAPPKPGHVTVRVNPWAEVFYNGKSYGTTPLKQPIEVPAGNVTFMLRNSQLGVNKKVSVKVAAGAEVVLKADLFKK